MNVVIRSFADTETVWPDRQVGRFHGIHAQADTALRLEYAFGVSAAFWLNLHAQYELEVAKQETGSVTRQTMKPRARVT